MNKCLAQSNKSRTGDTATKEYEFEVEAIVIRPIEETRATGTQRLRLGKDQAPSTEQKEASTMKLVSPDTHCYDYKKRRGAFLKELIASTPNVSLRAQELRRWIDKNSPYSANDEP
jgi:hypothetical protein